MITNETYYCEKCNRTLRAEEFYSSNNLEKYPNGGKLPQCKKCITMHVDNWDPETFLWILQEIDVPYIPEEWNKLMMSYARDGKPITGTSILGRYLSKMKLKQFKEYRWKDTEFLQQMANSKMEQTMKRQGYEPAEIAEAINKATYEMPDKKLFHPPVEEEPEPQEDYFDRDNDIDFNDNFTEEDIVYLRLKWGKTYKPEEWIWLEQLYNEMINSYDIQTAGHIDTLKMVCKTSLKANQLIDIGDVEGFQKMSKVYDTLMKSGKFTAAQNKAEQGEYVDSIAELVELCERQGYIERYYIDTPNDKVDETLLDMQRYTRNLIDNESNLSTLIEQAIKQNQREDAEAKDDSDEIILSDVDEVEKELKDKDFIEFNEFLEEEAEQDLLNFLEEDDYGSK